MGRRKAPPPPPKSGGPWGWAGRTEFLATPLKAGGGPLGGGPGRPAGL